MPKKKKKSVKNDRVYRRERMRAKRYAISSSYSYKNPTGLIPGPGDPAPLRGKSLNALRLAPPQGSLPAQAKGISPQSDSLQCVCAPMSAPSPKCEAGQTQLADSLPSVCTPESVPSPMCDAASVMMKKDAKIEEHIYEQYETAFDHVSVIRNKKQTDDLGKHLQNEARVDRINSFLCMHQMRVLQGSLHQGNSIFGSNAGKQCVANSLSCIAYSNIHPVKYWKTEDIDVILYTGNELYTYLNRSSSVQNEYLLVTELPEDVELYDTFLNFNYEYSVVGLLRGSYNEDLLDNDTQKLDLSLNAAFSKIFTSYEQCFISFGGNTFAALCIQNEYYVFDSHARSQDGRACPHGKATLIRYDNLQDIVAHCYTLSESLGLRQGVQFEITAVLSKRKSCATSIENFASDMQNIQAQNERRVDSTDDVVFIASEYAPHKFCPLTNNIRQNAVGKLKLLSRTSCKLCASLKNANNVQVYRSEFIAKGANKPCTFHKIKGDGNCFFRAVSYAIFDSDEHHFCLRHMTCDYLQQNSDFLLKQTHDYYSSSEYLQKSKMYSSGTWATAIEIISMSAILELSIYTYTNNKWLKYSAGDYGSDQGIYLYHANGNHYDVVLDVMDSQDYHDEFCDSRRINSREKEQGKYSKKGSAAKDGNFQKLDNLMEKYFCHQEEQHILKKISRENQSRQEYMQSYMKKWREKNKNKQNELKQDKMRKQKLRQEKKFRATERVKEKESKKKMRMDSSRKNLERKNDRERKSLIRSKVESRLIEKQKDMKARSKIRQNIDYRFLEKGREKEGKSKSRQNEAFRSVERSRDREARSKIRQNLDYRLLEREREKNGKTECRRNKVYRSIEKVRDRDSRANARKNYEFRMIERQRETVNKIMSRQDVSFRSTERINDRKARSQARKDEAYSSKERQMGTSSKKKSRLCLENHNNEKKRDTNRKRKLREDISFKENERKRKRAKTCDNNARKIKKELDKICKAEKRRDENYIAKEKESAKKRRYGKDLQECIEKFKKKIAEGPIYTCTCCHQTWFSHSVSNAKNIRKKYKSQRLQKCFTSYISEKNTEWICYTCKNAVNEGKIPKLALANKMGFPKRPPELNLHQLEERLVALRIPFMQIRELPRGGQLSIKGNIVNVPVEVQPTVNSLPRPFNENVTVSVRLKKKLSYKSCDLTENVRPLHVIAALHWLMKHSDLYKLSGIEIDDDWISRLTMESQEIVKEYIQHPHDHTEEKYDEENAAVLFDDNIKTQSGNMCESLEDVEEEDEFIEIDERETNSGNCDTIIDNANAIQENLYTFAPGEGQKPLGLYNDPDAEYLSFPSIFCGKRRLDNKERMVNVHYSDIVKWELRSIDRRAAQNVPNIFFKMKKIQMKQISDKVNLVLRRCKTEGKKLTAKDVLDPIKTENLARLDEGYYIFRSLRNSPPYLEGKKKELFAMIRQLGLPTWFVSLSAADTRWADQLSMLSQLNTGIKLSVEDVENLTWAEKTNLVKKDPVNSVRYFNHRVQEFLCSVLKSDHNPIGKVTDYFYRVEFQNRGSPHIHMLMWIEKAPVYQKDSVQTVTSYIDNYVSCSLDVKGEEKEYVNMQMHRHSKSCKKRGKSVCRFNFPAPPMPSTTILEPLEDEDHQKYKNLYIDIQKLFSGDKTYDTFQDVLTAVNITEEEYIKAVRSSLDGPKVFLKRQPNETRVNPYMKNLLTAWGANHDIQFVLDPFACVVYIVNYISKAQRGMSTLLDEACKEARDGNFDLRRQVRHMGNKFLNCVEISAQEASYLNLQLPLTQSTRDCVFINTSPPNQRTILLKQREQLEKLPDNSTDIEADNIIKRYSKRPKILERWCLADYAAELNFVYPKKGNAEVLEEDVNDDKIEIDIDKREIEEDGHFNITLKNGIKIKKRLVAKLIRYIRYSLKVDPENFYRERILLFYQWRNEDRDIIGGYNTYEEHYHAIQDVLFPKIQKYENNAEELDRATMLAAEGCNEDRFEDIAPGTEQSQIEDATEGSEESPTFAVFDPRRPENQIMYDIGQDLGLPVNDVNTCEVTLKRMLNDDYFASIRTLNTKQKEFFLHVIHWIKTKNEPLRVFLTGGAGVGKSVVVRLLHEALMRQLGTLDGQNPDLMRVLLCAPTGKAAYNIGGVTIHSAFGIPASQGFKCKPLTSDMLNSLRSKYSHLSVVIIDEVSMVGNTMFNLIHERLKQIRGNRDFFGGVHVILIGDLFQLKPVMDGWIFDNLKADFGPLATNLWQDLFCMHELTKIMRQKDDNIFSELLNRMREGNHTKADLEMLKTRIIDSSSENYPQMAPHLFIQNRSVNNYNYQVFNRVQNERDVVSSMDSFIGAHKSLNDKLQSLPKDGSKTAGLHSEVHVGVGLKYEVTANLSVSDGITNGTVCTLKHIDRRQSNISRPSIIWVQFEKPTVGLEWRQQYRHLYVEGINKSWSPIFDVKRTFTYLKHTVMRIQFPLRLAAAKTVHKAQGDTVDEVVVDLTTNSKFAHVHYVALSRVRKMSGLNILCLNENKISVSDKVKEEMKRLRDHAQLLLCYKPLYRMTDNCFKFGLLNVRSLRKHHKEIEFDRNLTACHVIGITETWLKSWDGDINLSMENFVIYRQDGASRSRGILFYCHIDVAVQEVGGHAEEDIEFYILDVQYFEQSYLIAVVYRAPNCNKIKFTQVITEKIKPLINETRHFIIAGDFNYDLRKNSFHRDFEQSFGCKQIVQKATHDTGSIIDHIYTNCNCIYTDVIETVFSDHKFVYACF